MGGGPRADDCLIALDVAGVHAGPRATAASCVDGDPACDHDGLANGRCEFWVQACFDATDPACTPRPVTAATVRGAASDRDRTILARTLDVVTKPVAANGACAPLTTVTVPVGTRKNGSTAKGRKSLALDASAAGAFDHDTVTLVCKPAPRVRKRDAISFPILQKRVFEKSCAFSSCHGVDNPQADLMLVGDHVYDDLVGHLASTAAAQFSAKKRVVPGDPTTSFLMDKLTGGLAPGEGVRMPSGRNPLPDAQIEAIRKWILAGAPRTRVIAGGLGEDDQQPRIPAPDPPAGGFQVHMDPFFLNDLPETEGCQYVRLDNPDDIYVQQWELFMHEGSHHFIVYALTCGPGQNDCDAPGFDDQFPTGFVPCDQFDHFRQSFLVGSQTPHFLVDYQTPTSGVGLALHRRQPLILNAHYTNSYANTLAEAWVNVTPADPAQVRHPAELLFEVYANAFIFVPPGTAREVSAFACDFAPCLGLSPPTGEAFALLGVTSHMHKRSKKFVTDLFDLQGARIPRADDMTDADDGSQHLYVSRQWSDPVNLSFWPPIVVSQGQHLDYSCFHDNGVTAPVKLGCEETAGVTPGEPAYIGILAGQGQYAGTPRWCHSDADCTGVGTGRRVPANLVLGPRADDDMCILPGLYYRCPGDASTCGN